MIYANYLKLIFRTKKNLGNLCILTDTSGIKILFFSLVTTSFMEMNRIYCIMRCIADLGDTYINNLKG